MLNILIHWISLSFDNLRLTVFLTWVVVKDKTVVTAKTATSIIVSRFFVCQLLLCFTNDSYPHRIIGAVNVPPTHRHHYHRLLPPKKSTPLVNCSSCAVMIRGNQGQLHPRFLEEVKKAEEYCNMVSRIIKLSRHFKT